jgi:hypothetical protein
MSFITCPNFVVGAFNPMSLNLAVVKLASVVANASNLAQTVNIPLSLNSIIPIQSSNEVLAPINMYSLNQTLTLDVNIPTQTVTATSP